MEWIKADFSLKKKDGIKMIYSKSMSQTFFFVQSVIKQSLDSVFVISSIFSVRVMSWSRRLRLITPTSTLIVLDITKMSSNNSLQLHCY